MNLNHLTFLSDIIMHHNNISSINLSTTSMGETWKNNLFRECLTFPPGGRKCIFVLFPSVAPENWGKTSQLQLLLITMGRFRISLRSGRSAALSNFNTVIFAPGSSSLGTTWHTLGCSPTSWGYCQGMCYPSILNGPVNLDPAEHPRDPPFPLL